MLTKKKDRIYQFIFRYILEHDYAPSIAEIAEGLGIKSKGHVHREIKVLEKAGLIIRTKASHRNIQLVDQDEGGTGGSLPILGHIAAGSPIEAIENNESLDIANTLLGRNRFVLKVKGDSMLGDNICDGDYIICERRHEMNQRDIAIVLINNSEATLKRLKNNANGTISLLPSNPEFPIQTYRQEAISVQGIYLGLLRLE